MLQDKLQFFIIPTLAARAQGHIDEGDEFIFCLFSIYLNLNRTEFSTHLPIFFRFIIPSQSPPQTNSSLSVLGIF